MTVTVIGCGKMGLPIAIQAASRGAHVIGVDINRNVVRSINAGICPINEPQMGRLLKQLVKACRLEATSDIACAVKRSDAVIVIVPVLIDLKKRADLKAIVDVTRKIARNMNRGTLVSYETTMPVGTTRNICAPILRKSGLKPDKDFFLVFSPERVKSLTVMEQVRTVPKIVGGYGPRSLKKGLAFYRKIMTSPVKSAGSLESAEMVKLAGMLYRDVNIALANEIARYCDKVKVDLKSITGLINTDGEANLLDPGIGVGGHCTPIYPYFLINDAVKKGAPQRLAALARDVNDSQSAWYVNRLASLMGTVRGKRIVLFGLGFRPGVKEDTASPAYLIKKAVEAKGGRVFLHDPLYSEEEILKKGFSYFDIRGKERLDAAILVTGHPEYGDVKWRELKKRGLKALLDGRNSVEHAKLDKEHISYIGIGRAYR